MRSGNGPGPDEREMAVSRLTGHNELEGLGQGCGAGPWQRRGARSAERARVATYRWHNDPCAGAGKATWLDPGAHQRANGTEKPVDSVGSARLVGWRVIA